MAYVEAIRTIGLPGADGQGRLDFLGVRFSGERLEEAASLVRRQAQAMRPFVYVTTPNVDHIVGLARAPGRAGHYRDAFLVLNDSAVLARLARFSGLDLPRATGADLVLRLLSEGGVDPRDPVTIIGADAGAVAAARRRYGLRDVRWHNPPMGLARNPAAIDEAAAFVARHRAPISLICVGSPQQEMVARAVRARGDAVGVGLCIGAGLHFAAGAMVRAPAWMRQAGLEWLHRLGREPRRLWRRYLLDGPEIVRIWIAWDYAQRASAWRASIASRSAF